MLRQVRGLVTRRPGVAAGSVIPNPETSTTKTVRNTPRRTARIPLIAARVSQPPSTRTASPQPPCPPTACLSDFVLHLLGR
ncbi:hypothetical protein T484DRAFT_1943878 [Baffinella frigidus]|nr:hypothetical protein T484DRAFT_1943878 [Cryptophyta sp. CCMP2293]